METNHTNSLSERREEPTAGLLATCGQGGKPECAQASTGSRASGAVGEKGGPVQPDTMGALTQPKQEGPTHEKDKAHARPAGGSISPSSAWHGAIAGTPGDDGMRHPSCDRGMPATAPAHLASPEYSEIRSGQPFCSGQAGEPTGDRRRRHGLVERAASSLRTASTESDLNEPLRIRHPLLCSLRGWRGRGCWVSGHGGCQLRPDALPVGWKQFTPSDSAICEGFDGGAVFDRNRTLSRSHFVNEGREHAEPFG